MQTGPFKGSPLGLGRNPRAESVTDPKIVSRR